MVSVGPRPGEGGQESYPRPPSADSAARSSGTGPCRGLASCAGRSPHWPNGAGRVVLSEGGVITAHHLCRDRDYDTVVATVEAHTASAGRVVLRNAGTQP